MAAETRLAFVDVKRSETNPQALLLAIGDFAQEFDNEVFVLTMDDAWVLFRLLYGILNASEGG